MSVIHARVSPLRAEKLGRSRAALDQGAGYVTRDRSQTRAWSHMTRLALVFPTWPNRRSKLPLGKPGLWPGRRILHACVETPACFAHREWNQDFCHLPSYALVGASHSKKRRRLHALQRRMCVGVLRWPAFPGAKSAAPRKRSMVAWRRRP